VNFFHHLNASILYPVNVKRLFEDIALGYISPGIYNVNLTVTDDYENTSTTSIIVIVTNVQPLAQAQADTNSIFEEEAIFFDASTSWDTPSDSLSFLWDFGDGTQSSEVSPIHVYQDQGEYTVTLTATDMYGGESKDMLQITVTNIEPWIIAANVTGMYYLEKPLHFTVTADDTPMDLPGLQYIWDFGDGTIAHQQNVTYMFPEAGTFIVTVTVTDNNGASDSAEIQITITDPEISTSVSSTSPFQDETIFFNATHELDDGSYTYDWYFGDGSTNEGKNVSHTFTKVGMVTPWLIVSDGNDSTTVFLPEITVVNVAPVPALDFEKVQVIEDEPVQFHATNSTDSPSDRSKLTYTWDFDDGSSGHGIEVTHRFLDVGNYIVTLTMNDGKTTNSTNVLIGVHNLPPTAHADKSTEGKATVGEPVILDASGTTDTSSDMADLNYTWTIGNNTIYGKVIRYTFEATGEIMVTLLVRDNNGATSEDTLTFQVSKARVSENEETMNAISWILIIVMLILLGVICFLFIIKNEAQYIDVPTDEEVISVEGKIDNEMFRPKGDDQEPGIVVVTDQEVEVLDEEGKAVEVEEETQG